jgi:hypothetical protein
MIRKPLLLFGVYAMSSLSARAQDQDKVDLASIPICASAVPI